MNVKKIFIFSFVSMMLLAGTQFILLSAQDRGQEPIRVRVDLVNVLLTVFDKQGRIIPDLTQKDVSIVEDGVPQEILNFNRDVNLPLTIALLVDTSESVHPKLKFEQDAATNFFMTVLQEKDRGLLLEFDSGVTMLQDFTSDPNKLAKMIRALKAGGGTSLYDAVYMVCDEKLMLESGRRTIVIVSDGDDTASKFKFEDALELTHRAEATIFAIGTSRGGFFGIPDKRAQAGDRALEQLTAETGGRTFFPVKEDDLEGSFQQIAQELRSQYSIGYISTNKKKDGGYRNIQIKLANKDYKVRHKKGYYAPKS
jgi:Ca-activated chloride channel family protein